MKRTGYLGDDDEGGFGDSVLDYLFVLLIIIAIVGVALLCLEWQVVTRLVSRAP